MIEDDVCMLELTDTEIVECRVTFKNGQARLGPTDGKQPATLLTLAQVQLRDDDPLDALTNEGRFLYFRGVTDGLVGCWRIQNGLDSWRSRRAKRKADESERKRRAMSFINPYTFVPFPGRIERGKPTGHDVLRPGNLSGSFTVRWEFTTPFQAPSGSVNGEPVRLPGASVKGAVRSLHEAVAGGCLRVLDKDFLPVYRDTASPLDASWTIGIVTKVSGDGQPYKMRLCDEVIWVRYQQLHAAVGKSELQTGSRVALPEARAEWKLGRQQLLDSATVRADGDLDWHVLLTDAATRPKAYYAACGHLGPSAPAVEVSEKAWRTFQLAVAGAREYQQNLGARGQRPVEVRLRDGTLIGRRQRVTGRFKAGDLVWARLGDDGEVGELRLSALWRHVGSGDLGKRTPKHLHPCGAWQTLCPSCRLFGSVDPDPHDESGQAVQQAYAGHVRFGDAVSGPVKLTAFDRAPLGAPRPGSGQFYLSHDDCSPAEQESELPTREWGAGPDHPEPRPVVGRKFYWNADPTRQPAGWQRHQRRPHQTGEMVKKGLLLAEPGTVLEQRITFDNLTEASLGGLLATIEPHRVADLTTGKGTPTLRLGGGKPLGLGSCRATVSGLQVWTAESRYNGGVHPDPDPDRYVGRFIDDTPAEVQATWPAIAAVLAEDTVDAEFVWYPPGSYWRDRPNQPEGDPAAKSFDEPYAFFAGTSGQYMKNAPARPLVPLPSPTAPDQLVKIIRDDDIKVDARSGHDNQRKGGRKSS